MHLAHDNKTALRVGDICRIRRGGAKILGRSVTVRIVKLPTSEHAHLADVEVVTGGRYQPGSRCRVAVWCLQPIAPAPAPASPPRVVECLPDPHTLMLALARR